MLDKKNVVIALGFFDSVHKGHRAVIATAKKKAEDLGVLTAVFSFAKNLKKALGYAETTVYSTQERRSILKGLGVEEILFAPVTKKFLSLSKEKFLDYLNNIYNVKAYVCGTDYTFGKGGLGNVEFLRRYAKSRGQEVVVCEDVFYDGEKISTTRIKKLLTDGKVDIANKLLDRRYSVTGKVFEDRKVGSKLGFPTVNIEIDAEKTCLKDGVYAGGVTINGKSYRSIINYGARPTFDLNKKLVEAHIVDFSGMLYGKQLTVYFNHFMREIIKFQSQDALVLQLKEDLELIRSGIYD